MSRGSLLTLSKLFFVLAFRALIHLIYCVAGLCAGASERAVRALAGLARPATVMPAEAGIDSASETCPLLNLQSHVLERILTRLHITDLARCCQVSKGMRFMVHQEGVWQSLCTSSFPTLDRSQLRGWITPSPGQSKVNIHQKSRLDSPQLLCQSSDPHSYRYRCACMYCWSEAAVKPCLILAAAYTGSCILCSSNLMA